MGELALIEIVKRMRQGQTADSIRDIPGTCWTMSVGEFRKNPPENAVVLPSYPRVTNRDIFANAYAVMYCEGHQRLVQPHTQKRCSSQTRPCGR